MTYIENEGAIFEELQACAERIRARCQIPKEEVTSRMMNSLRLLMEHEKAASLQKMRVENERLRAEVERLREQKERGQE